MNRAIAPLLGPLALAGLIGAGSLLAACESTDKPGSTGASNIFLDNSNNYHSTSALTIPTVETVVGDLDICWTNVTKDLQCHDVAPLTDLDNVGFLQFQHLTQAEVAAKLTAGEVTMSVVSGYIDYHTDHASTCAKLSQLTFLGMPIVLSERFVEGPDLTYLMVFNKGTTPGVGARTMTFVKPTSASVNTRVDAPTGCGLLDFQADLTTLTKPAVSANGPWVVDWRGVTLDGLGNPIVYQNITSVLIGFFANMTVADLQAHILDIEQNATTLWELPLTGARSADLALAKQRGTGAAFPGFTSTTPGVWLLGLLCANCQNPAPVVLTILEPAGGG